MIHNLTMCVTRRRNHSDSVCVMAVVLPRAALLVVSVIAPIRYLFVLYPVGR